MVPGEQTPTYFALKFAPSPELINSVRRFVLNYFEHLLGVSNECSSVALATHELLENAVRHCRGPEVTLRVAVAPLGARCLVTVRTRNDAARNDIASLRRVVDWISTERRSGGLNNYLVDATTYGGLGLARVAAEAGMEIDYDVFGREVEVRAQAYVVRGTGTTLRGLAAAAG